MPASASRIPIACVGLLLTLSSTRVLGQAADPIDDDARNESTRAFSTQPLRMHLRAGSGTLVGNLGMTASYDIHERFGFGLGLGFNPRGLQEAVFGRWRAYVAQGKAGLVRAVAVEAALSSGPGSGGYVPAGEATGQPFRWARISWFQVEAQYEVLKSSGLDLMTGIGIGIPVASTEPVCIRAAGCANESRSPLPAVSLSAAIGYSIW